MQTNQPAARDHRAVADLAIELQNIYDSEINVRISRLWDGGIDLRLGDDVKWVPSGGNRLER